MSILNAKLTWSQGISILLILFAAPWAVMMVMMMGFNIARAQHGGVPIDESLVRIGTSLVAAAPLCSGVCGLLLSRRGQGALRSLLTVTGALALGAMLVWIGMHILSTNLPPTVAR